MNLDSAYVAWIVVTCAIAGGLILAAVSLKSEKENSKPRNFHGAAIYLVLMFLLHIAMIGSLKYQYLDTLVWETSGGRGWDLSAVYFAGRAVSQHHSPYQMSSEQITPYRYLPFTAYTIGCLLSQLSFRTAYKVWTFANESLLFLILLFVIRPRWNNPWRLTAAAMLLGFFPLYGHLCAGQFDLLQGALILALMAASHQRFGRSSVLFWFLSILVKLNTLILVIPLVIKKRFISIMIALVAATILSVPWLVNVSAQGIQWVDGIHHLQKNFHQQTYLWFGNQGFRYLVFLSIRRLLPALSQAEFHPIAMSGSVIISAFFVLFAACASYRNNRSKSKPDILLWLVVFYLIAAEVWEFSYVSLLLPLTFTFLWYKKRRLLVPYGMLAVPTTYALLTGNGPPPPPQSYSLPAWIDIGQHILKPAGLLLLFIILASMKKRNDEP